MEQLTFLDELQDLGGERKSARRARRAPREAACGTGPVQRAFDFERAPTRRAARVIRLPTASAPSERDAD